MADMLQFKKGLLSGLAGAAKKAGTIYITTDERAMYVDVSDTERIRLGDFIEVPTEDALKSAQYQPYSTTALYYITQDNKLLKYQGTSGTDATFVVINSTSSIQNDLTNLTNLVNEHSTSITNLQNNLGTLETTVTNNKTATDTAISELTTTVATNKSDIEGALAAEAARAKAAEKANSDNIAQNTTNITNLQNTKADKTALEAEIEARANAINTVNQTISGINTRVGTLETTVGNASSGLVKDVADIQTKNSEQDTTITQMQSAHSELAGKVATTQTDISNLKTTVGDTASGLVKDVNDLKAAVKSNDDDIADLDERLDEVESVNGQQNTAITNLQNQVGNEANANGSIAATGLYLAIDNLKAKDQAIDGEISNLKGADSALQGRVSSLETNSATKTELGQTNTNLTNFQNSVAETYVTKTTYQNKIDAIDAEDARLAGLIGNNASAITTLNNTVGDADSGLVKDVADLKTTTAQQGTNITNLQNSLGNYVLTTKHNSDISELNSKISKNATDIAANSAAIGVNSGNIATNAGNISTNAGNIEQNRISISNLQSAVGSSTDVTKDKTLYEWVEALMAEDEDIYEYVDNGFAAADAMKFMGEIASTDALLDKTDVEAGHTYVLTVKDGDYAVGDLFIAKEDGVNTSITSWVHVPSGYVAANDPKLMYEDADSIKLQSQASGANLGSITFKAAANSSVTVVVSDDTTHNHPTVTVGMEWGSF